MRPKAIILFAPLLTAFLMGCTGHASLPTPSPAAAATTALPSLTQTSTPTPRTPVQSPTLPPAPRDFTEQFTAQPPYWTSLQINNGHPFSGPTVRNGFLAFDLSAPDQWAYALYTGREYTDVIVSADVQFRTAGDGAAGLVCRYDPKAGWYELSVYADKTYELLFGQWLATGVARYMPIYHGQSDAIGPDTDELTLQCQKNMLTVLVNGTQLRSWQELKYGLQQGQVGLAASSFQDVPFTAAFDWFKVSEP